MRRYKLKWRVCYGLSKSDHLTNAEVSGYRFQPQRQRHVLEDTLEASDHEKKDTREAERTKNKTSRDGVNHVRSRLCELFSLCLYVYI